MDDSDRDSRDDLRPEPGNAKSRQWVIVLIVVGVVVVAAAVLPRFLRPTLTVTAPSVDVQKQLAPLLTQSNLNLVMDLAKPVISNLAKGGSSTVIITSAPPVAPVAAAPATNAAPPPATIVIQPANPQPPSSSATPPAPVRAAGPRFELFPMPRNNALPLPQTAALANLVDSQELFRASRFTGDPALVAYRNQDLWLKWTGRLSVTTAGQHTFFHSINMDRVLPADGKKRPTDFGARGRQRVATHVYIDGIKQDSKDKRFSEIDGSLRTQFATQLNPGLHTVELWMGVTAEDAPYVYDEVSMTLELRAPTQSAPSRVQAYDLAW